jgi:hypothetical protein
MTAKKTTQLDVVLRLRLLVGFLGEKKQFNWWDTTFLDATGRRFLETVFPRTAFEAGLRCATEAARLVHDGQIGRVGAYHLFRFPVEIEDAIEGQIAQQLDPAWLTFVADRDAAERELQLMSAAPVTAPEGPVQVGTDKKVLSPDSLADMAAHYRAAFAQGIRCYPYFGAAANGRR